MSSSAARASGRSRLGAIRRAVVALLGVAAVLVGLLAMHAAGAGAEHHAAAISSSHAAPEPAAGGHGTTSDASASMAEHPAVQAVIAAVGAAVACDAECMSALGDCALMVMGCAMLLVLVAFVLIVGGPAMPRRLFDRGADRLPGALRVIPLHLRRPDLVVLSISRT